MEQIETIVVGAGVQAVTLGAGFNRYFAHDFKMVDPGEKPLKNWLTATAAQGGMDEMRTSWEMHVDTGDVSSLEYWEGRHSLRPSRSAFNRHAQDTVMRRGLDTRHLRGTVERIIPTLGSNGPIVEIHTADGDTKLMRAKRVIVATGLGTPNMMLTGPESDQVGHSADVDITAKSWMGKTVGVIGRGQSAATVAAYIADMGGKVTMIMRGELGRDQLEADHEFLPPSGRRYLDFMHYSNVRRAEEVKQARTGRGVTPEISDRVLRHETLGNIQLLPYLDVTEWDMTEDGVYAMVRYLRRSSTGIAPIGPFDQLISCTGYTYDATKLPFLADVVEHCTLYDGMPVLHQDLSVAGVPGVHIMGRGAELALGPLGRNLPGALEGTRRILKGCGVSRTDRIHIPNGRHHC